MSRLTKAEAKLLDSVVLYTIANAKGPIARPQIEKALRAKWRRVVQLCGVPFMVGDETRWDLSALKHSLKRHVDAGRVVRTDAGYAPKRPWSESARRTLRGEIVLAVAEASPRGTSPRPVKKSEV